MCTHQGPAGARVWVGENEGKSPSELAAPVTPSGGKINEGGGGQGLPPGFNNKNKGLLCFINVALLPRPPSRAFPLPFSLSHTISFGLRESSLVSDKCGPRPPGTARGEGAAVELGMARV